MDMTTTTFSNQELAEIEASGSGNNNNNNNYYFNSVMREHMFDKVLTPSDVGKLNRFVIPKNHAENYFPLEDNQNSTVLHFQDRNGKTWTFRYSYWNSSQSYVITKGWIRFVKEKNLEARDTVSFHRGYIPDDNEPEKQRKIMFIDWMHRANINLVHNINHHHHYPMSESSTYPTASYYPVTEYSMPHCRSYSPFYHNPFQGMESLGYGYGRIVNRGRYYVGSPLDHHHQWNLGRSEPLVLDLFPVYPAARVNSSAMLPPSSPSQTPEVTVKKLRLFGVDVEESSSLGETRGQMGFAGYSSCLQL